VPVWLNGLAGGGLPDRTAASLQTQQRLQRALPMLAIGYPVRPNNYHRHYSTERDMETFRACPDEF